MAPQEGKKETPAPSSGACNKEAENQCSIDPRTNEKDISLLEPQEPLANLCVLTRRQRQAKTTLHYIITYTTLHLHTQNYINRAAVCGACGRVWRGTAL